MWRYLVGAASALLLAAGGLLIWNGLAARDDRVPPVPKPVAALVAPAAATDDALPAPQATEATREQKRFNRYDHDKDGKIELAEYLQLRRKNFDKLDTNHDGKLSFEEYAAKAEAKFAAADADKSGALDAREFATTRVVRKTKPRCACAPVSAQAAAPAPAAPVEGEGDGDN
jgi:hypothetical protein